jgi:hypothetical protein
MSNIPAFAPKSYSPLVNFIGPVAAASVLYVKLRLMNVFLPVLFCIILTNFPWPVIESVYYGLCACFVFYLLLCAKESLEHLVFYLVLNNLHTVFCLGVYTAPEMYRNGTFDRSVDVFAFGLILYEMIEGTHAFHPKPPEEAAKMICLEGMRPPFKNKPKYYPDDLRELIQECWDPTPSVRPTFEEIIVRLNKISTSFTKQTRWRDTFKLPWKQASER